MVSPPTHPEASLSNPAPNPAPSHFHPQHSRPTLGALWSLLLYVLLLAGLWAIQQILFFAPAAHPASPPAAHATTYAHLLPLVPYIAIEAIDFTAIFLVSLFLSTLEDRDLGVFGLGGPQPISRLLHGALGGLLAMSVLILTLRSLHLLVFDHRLLYGPAVLAAGLTQLLLFLLVGLFEEYLFRGYLQFTLTRALISLADHLSPRHARAIAFWLASILTSAIFFYAHIGNSGENVLGLFQIFLAGSVFVFALWRTGSLWWGIGFHMAWDWAQSFLYGVPDSGSLIQGRLFATHTLGKPLYSGGTAGPEGSILCIPIFFLCLLVLQYTHPSPQPPLDPNP